MAAEWMPDELPQCVHYGIDCNPVWRVDLATLTDGRESPNLVWSQARHEYSLDFHTKNPVEYTAAKSHFMKARAQFKKWPFRDPLDFEVARDEGVVVETVQGYRIAKRYGSGSEAYDRTISRPTGAVLYEGDSVALGITINPENGYLVGVGSDGIDVGDFSWSGEFFVPVRYDIDRFPSKVTNRTGEGFFVDVSGIQVVEVRE